MITKDNLNYTCAAVFIMITKDNLCYTGEVLFIVIMINTASPV
jgi:hypothetical protein